MKGSVQWACILLALSGLIGCSPPDSEPQGMRLSVQLRADLEAQTSTYGPLTHFADQLREGTYTPDRYYIGARSWGIIECQDAQQQSMVCPAHAGIEIERHLEETEGFSVQRMAEEKRAYLIYAEDHETSFALPRAYIAKPGLYSGVQVHIDFIMTRFPLEESSGFTHPFHAILYCLNQSGCSNEVATYPEDMFAALATGNVQTGDLVLYDGDQKQWFYWDIDRHQPIPVSSPPPANRLRQPVGPAIGRDTAGGSWVYNASFGALEEGLQPLRVGPVNKDVILTLTIAFGVENTMYLDDINENRRMDADELWSLRFGKPRMTAITLLERIPSVEQIGLTR